MTDRLTNLQKLVKGATQAIGNPEILGPDQAQQARCGVKGKKMNDFLDERANQDTSVCVYSTDEIRRLRAERDALQARVAELDQTLWQLLDDMGDGLCVCQQAKDEARAARKGKE